MRPTTVRFEIPAPCLRWPQSDALADRLIALVQSRDCKRLILDFGRADFVTAAALGKLIAVRKALLSRGKRVVLWNLRPQVYEVLCVTGLVKLFDVRRAGVSGTLRPNFILC
jgi:anti-anti-sigma factor